MGNGVFIMNKIAALLVALAAAFSFSQENTRLWDRDSLEWIIGNLEAKFETEQSTIKKTVDSLGNVEKNAFKEVQIFYNNFINTVTLLVSILIAISVALVGINFKSNDNLKKEYEKTNNIMLETKKDLKNIDEKFLNLENELKKKNENKFNGAYKKIAEIYYIFARDELSAINKGKNEEYKNEHWFWHFMCLASFYYALTKMSKFSDNELIFVRFVKKFANEYNENIPMPDIKFFYHFLTFLEHSEKISGVIFEETKIIYNKLLKIFDYDKVIKCIEKSEFDEEEKVPSLLKLAERYKDKEYLKIFNFDKL
jgi:hypothetical protein